MFDFSFRFNWTQIDPSKIGGPEDVTHGVFISGIFNDGTQKAKTNFPSAYNL